MQPGEIATLMISVVLKMVIQRKKLSTCGSAVQWKWEIQGPGGSISFHLLVSEIQLKWCQQLLVGEASLSHCLSVS